MARQHMIVSLAGSLIVALCGAAQAHLPRAPQLLEAEQIPATNKVRLLWAPGGNTDGTLSPDVVSYIVDRNGVQVSTTYDQYAMIHEDSPTAAGTYTYTVRAGTNDGHFTSSNSIPVELSYPLYPLDEALDGKVLLSWADNGWTPPQQGGYTLSGWRVQRWSGSAWIDRAELPLMPRTYTDTTGTIVGVNRYRVQAKFTKPQHVQYVSSNEEEITISAMCDGQDSFPGPLQVVELTAGADGIHTGEDIAAGLQTCATYQGCILRAQPVTYENVAIMITYNAGFCDDPDQGPTNYTKPNHCLALDFPNGLVIEGHGKQTVFRSPVWTAPYNPAAVLEIHRRNFPFTIRNVVLDGRKHEQVWPGAGVPSTWMHMGFRVWNQTPFNGVDGRFAEILGDGIGDDDALRVCNREACSEDPSGGHDGDGRCDAGEACVDASGITGSCNTDSWPNAVGCEPMAVHDGGCIHNVEARDFIFAGTWLTSTNGWIVEDSEFHDVGCVNRGYGFDCPRFGGAPDLIPTKAPGYKAEAYGLEIDAGSNMKIRRNEFYRAVKYALGIKNGDAQDCNGLNYYNEIADNDLHDLGSLGIFMFGTVGGNVHNNTITGTFEFNELPAGNGDYNNWAMSLGGRCSDANEFYENPITDAAGMAIAWDGATETVVCDGSGCVTVLPAGNEIRDTEIDGACLQKDTAPTNGNFQFGAIHTAQNAGGILSVNNVSLINSQCRHAFVVEGANPGTHPLYQRLSGGSYEVGDHTWTSAQASAPNPPQTWRCGAIHIEGADRKLIVGDDVTITNASGPLTPKACVGNGASGGSDATLVVDDVPTDPFADSGFSGFETFGTDGIVIECHLPENQFHPDCGGGGGC